jgi:hypothetical protein
MTQRGGILFKFGLWLAAYFSLIVRDGRGYPLFYSVQPSRCFSIQSKGDILRKWHARLMALQEKFAATETGLKATWVCRTGVYLWASADSFQADGTIGRQTSLPWKLRHLSWAYHEDLVAGYPDDIGSDQNLLR